MGSGLCILNCSVLQVGNEIPSNSIHVKACFSFLGHGVGRVQRNIYLYSYLWSMGSTLLGVEVQSVNLNYGLSRRNMTLSQPD